MRATSWFLLGVAACATVTALIDAEPWRFLLPIAGLGLCVGMVEIFFLVAKKSRRKRDKARRRFQRSVPLFSTDLHGASDYSGIALEVAVVLVVFTAVAAVVWTQW